MLAGLFSGGLVRVVHQGRVIVASIAVFGLAVAGFGVVLLATGAGQPPAVLWVPLVAAGLFLALAGGSDSVSSVFRQTILQSATPDDMRGRLQGIFIVVVAGGPRLGDLVLGTAATWTAESWAALGGGLLCVVLVLAVAASPARILGLRRPSPSTVTESAESADALSSSLAFPARTRCGPRRRAYTAPMTETPAPYRETIPQRRIRIPDLQQAKDRGERWAMLTSYDTYTAALFERAGVWALLVGDSAANTVYGYDSTLPITVDELIPLARAVVRSTRRALVIADLPFGSYEEGPNQALATATRFMKEAGSHAVKLEGGVRVVDQIRKLVSAGIPVMGHIGFTPQSEHALGGYRVQGRGDAADEVLADAHAVAEAGAFAIVLEMVPVEVAKRITAEVDVPTVGIGAGSDCDAQVLVWQDMLGLRTGKLPRFVRQYADLDAVMGEAVGRYVDDVRTGALPGGGAHLPRRLVVRVATSVAELELPARRADERDHPAQRGLRAHHGGAARGPPVAGQAGSRAWPTW